MKTLILGCAAAAATLAIAPALAQTPPPAQVAPHAQMGKAQSRAEVARHVQAMFAQLDADRNGWLSKAEADAGMEHRRDMRSERRADHTFDQLDSDRNGSISRAEFEAAHAKRGERMADRKHNRMEKGGRAGGHMLGGRMFEMSDTNKDGKITLQEATASALQRFDMADANRDGQITREERSQMRQRMRAERRPG